MLILPHKHILTEVHFADKYVMVAELEQAVVTNVASENIVASRYEVLLPIFTTFKEHRTVWQGYAVFSAKIK